MDRTHSAIDRLTDLVLGALSVDGAREVEQHLAACEPCRRAAAEVAETFAAIALAVSPVLPSPPAQHRFLAALAASPAPPRFALHLDEVASLLDLNREAAATLLRAIDDASTFSPLPGVEGFRRAHVPLGPRVRGAAAAVLWAAPGARFPTHRHVGVETVLVLDGGLRDGHDGRVYDSGAIQHGAAGATHAWTALDDGCLCIGVVLGGLEIVAG